MNIFKYASRAVIEEDYRQGTKRTTSRKWEEALMALNAVKTGIIPEYPDWMNDSQREAITAAAQAHADWWESFPDLRMWSYAVGSLGGHQIRCVVPVKAYKPAERLPPDESEN